MKAHIKPTVIAAVLATSALAVLAQPAAPEGGPGPDMRRPDPERHAQMHERMKEHMARRAAELKAKLKLTPEQEGSWNAYVAAMKPQAHMPRHEELDKLSTPERLDKMREMRKQRDAEFDKRDAATRSFYGSLSAEQKKVFDEQTARPMHHEGPPPQGRR